MVSFLLKVSGELMKRSGTLKGTRSPPHAVSARGALNSMREERSPFIILTLIIFLESNFLIFLPRTVIFVSISRLFTVET